MRTPMIPGAIMWWGYLHQNGSIQTKQWFGVVAEHTDDCRDNEFVQVVQVVVPPL